MLVGGAQCVGGRSTMHWWEECVRRVMCVDGRSQVCWWEGLSVYMC